MGVRGYQKILPQYVVQYQWSTDYRVYGTYSIFCFLFYRPTCEFTHPPTYANGSRGSCRCRGRERRFVREANPTCVCCECTALVIDHGQYCSLLYFVFGLNETVSVPNQLGTGERKRNLFVNLHADSFRRKSIRKSHVRRPRERGSARPTPRVFFAPLK